GALVYFCGAGDRPAPDPETQYRIGSISKSLTAAVVLALRDRGALTLDQPLATHLPEAGVDVGALWLRQLLGHVGGLQREPDGLWWERSAGGDLAALLARVGPDKLGLPAYRGYHYSNLAYGLLGGVIARVTGDDWMTAVRERLLDPLGMGRTGYTPIEPFARGYVVHPWQGTLREEPRHDAGALAPARQLRATGA